MQEEVENRTVNLAVSTTKLTARVLARAFRFYIAHRSHKRAQKKMTNQSKEGKQTVEDLMKSGVSTDKIELPEGSAKDFCRLAKKMGVDYAIRKDKTKDPPRYIVFFKAKDTEVLDQVVKEYVNKTKEKQDRASVKEQLKAEKAAAKAEKAKKKTKVKKRRKERVEGR